MTRAVVLVATLGLLVGCASDPRNLPLAGVDLSDMSTVQDIRSQLYAHEGAAFANYVVKHVATSANFCGRVLVGPEGKPPTTVGEAIELTLAKDAEDRRAAELATKFKPFWDLQQEWNNLTERRDMLVDAQKMLRTENGSAAERLPQWKSFQAQLTDVNRRLVELEPKVFGADE